MKKVIFLTILMLIVISFSDLIIKDETIETVVQKEEVSITIIGKEKEIIAADSYNYKKNTTAFDILKKITKDNKIQMETKGVGDLVYISGIDNLYEQDEGPMSGWIYKVNGNIPDVGIASYILEPNDNVEVIYVLDFGKEIW